MVDVEISALPATTLEIAGSAVGADVFRIVSADGDVDIRVYYSHDGEEWLALESVLRNGRTMRYEQVDSARSVMSQFDSDAYSGLENRR
jgi:hypothetical protein